MTDIELQLAETFCKIDNTKEIEYPPIALSIGTKVINTKKGNEVVDIPIGTYGNFSFIQAPPKSRKSYFVSLLVSAYLRHNNFVGKIKSHRKSEQVLHFDTEQGHWHSARSFRRVIDMCGTSDGYHTFALRTINYSQRMEFIEYCFRKHKNIGICVIDGIADLVNDANNIEQSNDCVQKLMKWSTDFKCHIITVIHSNFGTDKPTGHLGSFLEKKAETQRSLEKNTVHSDQTTVTCKRSRGFPFENLSFKINNFGYPEIIENFYDPLKGT